MEKHIASDSFYINTEEVKMLMNGQEYFVDEYSAVPLKGESAGLFDEESEDDNLQPAKKEKQKTFQVGVIDRILYLSPKDQIKYYLILGLVIIGLFFILGRVFMFFDLLSMGGVSQKGIGPIDVFMYLAKGSLKAFFLITIISLVSGFLAAEKFYKKASRMKGEPEEQSIIRNDSNDFMNKDLNELLRTFDNGVVSPDNPVNIPLCMINETLYCIPEEPKHYQFKNQNVAVIGMSGGGKTFDYLEPILMTKILIGDSFVVSDTKGDLYRKYARLCEKYGYKTFVFNTASPEYSDAWWCFKDIVNASDGNAWNAVNSTADTIIHNTGHRTRAKNDDFWTQNEQNLLRALLFYVCRSKSFTGRRTMEGLMQLLENNGVRSMTQILTDLPANDPAFITSSPFRTQEELKVKDSTLSGLKTKLNIFQTEQLAGALSYDEIDFENSVHEQTAIFLITSDNDPKYDVVTSLFVTALYNKLMIISDAYGGKLKSPYWLILDEICNMAAINALSRKISTNRSRNVHFIFAIQSIPQLDVEYPGLAKNILSNCSTWVTPGVNDQDTADLISKRCGKVVRWKKDDMYEAPPLIPQIATIFSRRRRWTKDSQELLPASRIMKLDGQVLVCIATKEALLGEPYTAMDHPLYQEAVDISTAREPKWVESYLEEHPEKKRLEMETYTPSEFELRERVAKYPEKNKETVSDVIARKFGIRVDRSGMSEQEVFEQQKEEESKITKVGAKSVAQAIGMIHVEDIPITQPQAAEPEPEAPPVDLADRIYENPEEPKPENPAEREEEELTSFLMDDADEGFIPQHSTYEEEPASREDDTVFIEDYYADLDGIF